MTADTTPTIAKARAIFQEHGGTLRTSEALEAGIHPRTLYTMRDEGVIEALSRGVYRLTEADSSSLDLMAVAKRVPEGIVCLVSALAFHELTTQIPHEVHLAIRRDAGTPSIDYPPVRIFRYDEATFEEGCESHDVDGVDVRIYNSERTIADCFKYRNKIGKDVAIEALRLYRSQRRPRVRELLHYARLSRVEKVMLPYLEAVL